MALAIKVENLSKAYQLGEIGTGSLSSDLQRWIAKAQGKEDPFLKIGETNDRTTKGASNIVWSLKDINFEINEGDAVGIIGRNGAGKSTLLKLLSRVTSPTTGNFKVKGRIASLLEVGTGFHPELSGRDNIYLNGAILGMRKKEITRKFDEIVDFSGVERYIDTPVKRYSSGMYVRLAFAVSAYLESEILIVDEVLAVGDAEFQKKCIGKMGDISKGEGRTILFVSHNMTAVENLCKSGIYLKNGKMCLSGDIDTVIRKYNSDSRVRSSISLIDRTDKIGNGKLKVTAFYVLDEFDEKVQTLKSGNNYKFIIEYANTLFPEVYKSVVASLALVDDKNQMPLLVRSSFTNQNLDIRSRRGRICCEIKDLALANGVYTVTTYLGYGESEIYDLIENVAELTVEGGNFFGTGSYGLPLLSKVLTRSNWLQK